MTATTGARLVWVPPGAQALIDDAPDGLEVVETPEDPGSDPRIGEVELLVAKYGLDLSPYYPAMTSLRVIQTTAVGAEHYLSTMPDGVVLATAKGAADGPVSEWVLAAILAGLNEFAELRDEQLVGIVRRRATPALAGSHVLILGSGSIGRAVIRLLEPFGCTVTEVARRPRPGIHVLAELPALIPDADVVVVLLPLTPETVGIVDADFLAAMRPGALLVNAGRGKVVDTDALVDALVAGRVRAVLDVTDPEPLPADHPLRSAPGVLITPHHAGMMTQRKDKSFGIVTAQLERFVRGEPLENVVTDGY